MEFSYRSYCDWFLPLKVETFKDPSYTWDSSSILPHTHTGLESCPHLDIKTGVTAYSNNPGQQWGQPTFVSGFWLLIVWIPGHSFCIFGAEAFCYVFSSISKYFGNWRFSRSSWPQHCQKWKSLSLFTWNEMSPLP